MNVTAHQEKEKNEETKIREGQEKRENRQLILKKLCAALLQSFSGQHGEKMKGSARGNWDPRKGQQPFQPNPNGARNRTTTLRRLLIGAVDGPGPGELPGFWGSKVFRHAPIPRKGSGNNNNKTT